MIAAERLRREPSRPIRIWVGVGARGARKGGERGDVVMVVDALRASVTITAALRAGGTKVIPVRSADESESRLVGPRFRVVGERGGAKLPGFHYGNSPTEVWDHRKEIDGRALVLTTSNGTRCVGAALPGTAALGVGSTINALAVARAALGLARQHGCDVALVAAGLNDRPTEEDTFSEGVIFARLSDLAVIDADLCPRVREADSQAVFLSSASARRLAALGYGRDVRFCARVDVWATVPIYEDGGFVVYTGS